MVIGIKNKNQDLQKKSRNDKTSIKYHITCPSEIFSSKLHPMNMGFFVV